MASRLKLLSFCASHINCRGRWQAFEQMLDSWRGQRHRLDLIVSMSVEPGLKDQCKLPDMEGLTIIRQDGKLSQFQHFKHLSGLRLPADTWVMFTDDDDLWHPYRAHFYHNTLHRAESSGVSPAYVNCRATAIGEQGLKPRTAAEVTRLVEAGRIKIEEPVTSMKGFGTGNFVEYAVRMSSLRGFTQNCDPRLLRHPFCDMGFVRYMRSHTFQACLLNMNTWLYFYRYDSDLRQVTLDVEGHSVLEGLKRNIELHQIAFGSCNCEAVLKETFPDPAGAAYYKAYAQRLIKETGHLSSLPDFVM